MITDSVPRKVGLDLVVDIILESRNPLQDLAAKLGHLLYPDELIKFRGVLYPTDAEEFITRLEQEREAFLREGKIPSYGDPLTFIREGKDYLDHSQDEKKATFWFADQLYFLVIPELNAYNPSFGISVFPEEMLSIQEREAMMEELDHPRFPRNYTHVKTILLYDRNTNKHYLVVVPGEQRVNMRNVKEELFVKNLRFADNPEEIVGREPGAVSPFVHDQYFANIERILFAEELLVGHSKPHYSIPIDKRAALVLADTSDLIGILREVHGFPKIVTYNNKPTLSK